MAQLLSTLMQYQQSAPRNHFICTHFEQPIMEAMRAQLHESYASKDSGELLRLGIQPTLGDNDYAVIEAILSLRGVDLTALRAQRQQYAEMVAHGEDKHLAGLYKRAMAATIDTIGIALVLALSALLITVFLPNLFKQTNRVLVILLLAYILLKDGFHGQSLGKHFMRIRVVDSETEVPCNLPQSFLRNLVALTVLDWFFALGKSQQRLGDVLAKTKVVRTR